MIILRVFLLRPCFNTDDGIRRATTHYFYRYCSFVRVSIPLTVLGGLQPLTVLVGIFAVCRFNTDDGIRRATTDKTGPCQENDLSFQYR